MADANHRACPPAANTASSASSIACDEPVYLLSEEAHSQLRSVQECLHLLYLLTQARGDDPPVSSREWTGCLHLLCKQLRVTLDAVPWHGPV